MASRAAFWLSLALCACTAAGCISLPVWNLDPGPSSDPNADHGQEFLRRVVPGMPVEQARRIVGEVAPYSFSRGETGYHYSEWFVCESWPLDDERFLSMLHDKKNVRDVKIGSYRKESADPGQECMRRIQLGMPRYMARWIVLETAPNAGMPSTTVTCAGILTFSDFWLLGGSQFLRIWYDGQEHVEYVQLN
jgi:hypothetical protein